MTDLHIHTNFSFDSKEPTESYVRAAAARGDIALGFSEHCDYDVFLESGERERVPDFKAFFAELDRLTPIYPAVKVLRGVELGYAEDALSFYRKIASEYDFDYAIMSIHTLKGRGDCYHRGFYEGWSKAQAYGAYLSALRDAVRSDADFQIVGHVGYVGRYAPYEDKRLVYAEFPRLFDDIIDAMIARGLCLELNTKGVGGVSEIDLDFIERYLARGGKNFTLGSDAHALTRYRDGAEAVRQFLLAHGVEEICRFERRRLIREKL